MKKLVEKIWKKKLKKILIIFVWLYFVLDSYHIYVDFYNFRQLWKVKEVLKDLKRSDEQFFYLKDFNEIYNVNIEPIKNCYYLRSYKWEDRVPYIFWFKLESLAYRILYRRIYYAYPKYDLPISIACAWECIDTNKNWFIKTVSNPCED